MKCSKCKKMIKKVAYIKGKAVCQKCFKELKQTKRYRELNIPPKRLSWLDNLAGRK